LGLSEAQANLGVGSVSGIWAYQGSRPLVYDDRSYTAMGDLIRCVDNESGEVVWEKQFKVDDSIGGRALTPPAFANGCLYMGSLEGDIVCIRIDDGKKLWSVNIGETIRFQPIVAKGKVYVGTDLGNIYCLDTGDKKADGWYMWGGNAAHNGWES
jgi:outer membrane protein assembly factor BamB